MKGPIGKCHYCGQEFMSKPGLAKHEAYNCPQRPYDPTRETVEDPTLSPVTKLDSEELKKAADEGSKVRKEIETRMASMTNEKTRWRQVTRVGGGIGWVRQ